MKWLAVAAWGIFWVPVLWWLALSVLAMKGLLFHRHERREAGVNFNGQPPPEYQPPDLATKGCLWAIIVAFWPMALAHLFNEWLVRREAKDKPPNS